VCEIEIFCVYVCVKERERETDSQKIDRDRNKEICR